MSFVSAVHTVTGCSCGIYIYIYICTYIYISLQEMYENLRMQIPYMSVDENCPPRAFFFSSSSIIYIKWKKSGKPPKGKKKCKLMETVASIAMPLFFSLHESD